MIGLIQTIIVMFAFGGVVLLYYYARTAGLGDRPSFDDPEKVTNSEKLRMSKMHDAAFFDGESEDYAEHLSKTRQYGA
ncbi:MAG: hypothetical protein ACTSPB_23865 [Candidatus Thorarchaeota archaeon]